MKKEAKIQPMDEKNLKLFFSLYLYRKEKEVKTQKIGKIFKNILTAATAIIKDGFPLPRE